MGVLDHLLRGEVVLKGHGNRGLRGGGGHQGGRGDQGQASKWFERHFEFSNEQKEKSRKVMQEKIEDEIEFQEAMLAVRKKFKKDLMPILKSEERVNMALKVDRELLNKMRDEMMRRKRPMQ